MKLLLGHTQYETWGYAGDRRAAEADLAAGRLGGEAEGRRIVAVGHQGASRLPTQEEAESLADESRALGPDFDEDYLPAIEGVDYEG